MPEDGEVGSPRLADPLSPYPSAGGLCCRASTLRHVETGEQVAQSYLLPCFHALQSPLTEAHRTPTGPRLQCASAWGATAHGDRGAGNQRLSAPPFLHLSQRTVFGCALHHLHVPLSSYLGARCLSMGAACQLACAASIAYTTCQHQDWCNKSAHPPRREGLILFGGEVDKN